MPKFSGTERINASPERVWEFMMDPRRFTACAPAMKNVRIKNDREFTFDVDVPGRSLEVKARWEQLQEPSYARLKMQGGGWTGGAKLDNEFRISPDGDAGSSVDWSSDVELTGAAKMLVPEDRLRSMVDSMNQDVIACIRREIESG